MKRTYFALTIGPIYKTLSQAERTREFWGSSYMFSWIMREIILGMISEKVITEDDILMPHRDRHDVNFKVGTGLYHDRMIAQIKPENKKSVLNDFKLVANKVLEQLAKFANLDPEILQSYFRLNVILFDLESDKNIVLTVTRYLDSLELQNPIFHEVWKLDWPSVIDDLNGSHFYDNAFKKDEFEFVFDSITEIATHGLKSVNETEYNQLTEVYKNSVLDGRKSKKEEIDQQDILINQLSSSDIFKNEFYNYHKYIAIVHADGDNLGETISKIGTNADQVKKLSKALFSFAYRSVGIISKYGGTNVYAGGDDLLFFAPVANGKQTIFSFTSVY